MCVGYGVHPEGVKGVYRRWFTHRGCMGCVYMLYTYRVNGMCVGDGVHLKGVCGVYMIWCTPSRCMECV